MPEGFCETCNGKCCTEFTVYVTHADVRRLLELTGWQVEQFVTTYSDDGKCNYPLVRFPEFNVRLGLTYTDKRCIFLKVEGDRRRCTVQSHKPMVCRTYPFSVNDDGELVHVEPYKCPGPIWPKDETDRARAIMEVRALQAEYQEYESLVDMWNALPIERRTDLKAFLDFTFSNSRRSTP